MGYCAIHTKSSINDTLKNTFETFDSASDAFGRMIDLVTKEGYYGAYLVDDEGRVFDRYEERDCVCLDIFWV